MARQLPPPRQRTQEFGNGRNSHHRHRPAGRAIRRDAAPSPRAIGRACRETGFFYVVGHGIAPRTVETVFAMSRAFFAQPLAAKQQAAFSGPSGNRGWIKLGNEVLDPGKPHDLKEAFNIGLELAARRSRGGGRQGRSAASMAGPTFAGFPHRRARLFRRLLAPRAHAAPRLRASTSASRRISSRASSTRPMATVRLLHYPPAPADSARRASSAPASTPTTATSRCSRPTRSRGLMVRHRSGAMDQGAVGAPMPSSATSATA